MLLPWNECSIAIISWSVEPSFKYAYFLASFIAPSTASVPLFVKNTLSMPEAFVTAWAAFTAGSL